MRRWNGCCLGLRPSSLDSPRDAAQHLCGRKAAAADSLHGGGAGDGGRRDELPEGVADLGAAIEMLHTYSLIHDDLPALDNDDLRRGQPTCHVAFGEATAILAGDALQTLAFQTMAKLPTPATTTVRILREISDAVGTGVGRVGAIETGLAPGMIGGQVMDIEGEQQKPTAEIVEAIHRAKTGALITVSIVAGGLYGAAAAGSTQRGHD